jgi:pantetheine-phosphate adenylyltransferase
MKKIALYPGSFDPFTKGHENILQKALGLFDEIIIGIGVNTSKNSLFTLDSRIQHIQSLIGDMSNVKVRYYTGLTTDFCQEIGANYIIRGLRSSKDFDYELPIAHTNKILNPSIETIYLTSDSQFIYIQSNIIREIDKCGGIIDEFVTNKHFLVHV